MMAFSALKDKISIAPYSGMSDVAVSDSFNAAASGNDVLHSINVGALERYLASEGILTALTDEAASGGSGDASVTSVARELVALVDSSNVDTFDIHHPRAQGGLSVLAGFGLISAAQKGEITALGVTQQNIWQEIGMPSGTTDDVMRARTL